MRSEGGTLLLDDSNHVFGNICFRQRTCRRLRYLQILCDTCGAGGRHFYWARALSPNAPPPWMRPWMTSGLRESRSSLDDDEEVVVQQSVYDKTVWFYGRGRQVLRDGAPFWAPDRVIAPTVGWHEKKKKVKKCVCATFHALGGSRSRKSTNGSIFFLRLGN